MEIGILDGYSLSSFVEHTNENTKIVAVDLFEKYEYKSSNYSTILERFSKYSNVKIEKGNFYEYFQFINKTDLIHIDISNDADTYKFAVEHYLPLCNKALLLEGGSLERDNVDWMIKYNKPPINKYLKQINDNYEVEIIPKYPSITIIKSEKIND